MCVALGRGQHSPKAADWGFTVPCPVFRLAHLESSRAACSLKFLMLHTLLLTTTGVASGRLAALTPHDLAGTRPAGPRPGAPGAGRPRRARARWRGGSGPVVPRAPPAPRGPGTQQTARTKKPRNCQLRPGPAAPRGGDWRCVAGPIRADRVMTGDRAAGRRELADDPDPRGPGISYRDEDPALRPGSTPVEPALPGT